MSIPSGPDVEWAPPKLEHAWFLVRRAPNEYQCRRCGAVVADFDENDPPCHLVKPEDSKP